MKLYGNWKGSSIMQKGHKETISGVCLAVDSCMIDGLEYYNVVSATTVFLLVPYCGMMSVDVTCFNSCIPSSSIASLQSALDSSLQRKGCLEYKIAQAFASHFRRQRSMQSCQVVVTLHLYLLQTREETSEGSYRTRLERLAAVRGLQLRQHPIVQLVST